MQPDGEPEQEEAGEVYETGDFVAQFCGTAFGIEHWVCPVTREIIPFNGFVVGPGPRLESATDRYAVDSDADVPVMVATEWHDAAGEGATVVFKQLPSEEARPVRAAEPPRNGLKPATFAVLGVAFALVILLARRLRLV
jgi:hypothetical protein